MVAMESTPSALFANFRSTILPGLCEQVVPPGGKWMNHIHYTGSCIALTFLFIKPATKRDLLVDPIAAGT